MYVLSGGYLRNCEELDQEILGASESRECHNQDSSLVSHDQCSEHLQACKKTNWQGYSNPENTPSMQHV